MSIRDYYIETNKKEMCIEESSRSLNVIGTWLRTLRNKLKGKDIISVRFCVKIEYCEKQ